MPTDYPYRQAMRLPWIKPSVFRELAMVAAVPCAAPNARTPITKLDDCHDFNLSNTLPTLSVAR
jgi:hypothetical protein